jgi:hypothetical protein
MLLRLPRSGRMIRLAIMPTAFEAIAATLITALLLAGAASARAETIHGALAKAYGTHDLDRAPQTRRHARPRPELQRTDLRRAKD